MMLVLMFPFRRQIHFGFLLSNTHTYPYIAPPPPMQFNMSSLHHCSIGKETTSERGGIGGKQLWITKKKKVFPVRWITLV